MDLEGLAIGVIVGFIGGALIFTSTGREVSRATGSRAAHYIRPKNGNGRKRR